MSSAEFARLIDRMAQVILRGDTAGAYFTPDGVYLDAFHGERTGHAAIGDMILNHFHANACELEWRVSHAIADGDLGYASYEFS